MLSVQLLALVTNVELLVLMFMIFAHPHDESLGPPQHHSRSSVHHRQHQRWNDDPENH